VQELGGFQADSSARGFCNPDAGDGVQVDESRRKFDGLIVRCSVSGMLLQRTGGGRRRAMEQRPMPSM
jgi:hypothetical protein